MNRLTLAGSEIELREESPGSPWRKGRQHGRAILVKTATQGAALARLRREHETLAGLHGAPALKALALESVPGGLALICEDPGAKALPEGPLAAEAFLELAIKIAGALDELHRRELVHKDLKPESMLIGTDGSILFRDFGIATRLPRQQQTVAGASALEGTPAYMAPEQTGRMNRFVDARADLYSVGVIFYRLLTGKLPFQGRDALEWMHAHIALAPTPPSAAHPAVPGVLSELVMRLLVKVPEERYQSARGLKADLEACLARLGKLGRIDSFPLGARDASPVFRVSQKLYGRQSEVEELFSAFELAAEGGMPQAVFIGGYAGIGKSSVVHELYRPLVRARGLFLSGKFDQYQRDTPYATIAQAFRGLVTQLLTESDETLAAWRGRFEAALGEDAALAIAVLPQLRLITGKKGPAPDLPAPESARRLERALRGLFAACARPEQPLVLFLDDLQWSDPASLHLIQNVLTHPETRHLLFIGAYRDNEIAASHPLPAAIEAIEKTLKPRKITLGPLPEPALVSLLEDTLRRPGEAGELAALVMRKTGGNPFFVSQFLYALQREGVIALEDERWTWSMERLSAMRVTDNVLDMMASGLRRLPKGAQRALSAASLLGARFNVKALASVVGRDPARLRDDLWPACVMGFVVPAQDGESCAWAHDRVQQAAHSLLPAAEVPSLRLAIGRAMLAQEPESVFESAAHLNAGAALITDAEEKLRLCALNLAAGQRSKRSNAYAAADAYLSAGLAGLPEDAWESHYELAFRLHRHAAECRHLAGRHDEAGALFKLALEKARTTEHQLQCREQLAVFHMNRMQFDEAIRHGLEALSLLGLDLPREPAGWKKAAAERLELARRRLLETDLKKLVDHPDAIDPKHRAAMQLLERLVPPAHNTSADLLVLIGMNMALLSLEHGHSEASPYGYAAAGCIFAAAPQEYELAFELGELSLALADKMGVSARKSASLFVASYFTRPFRRPLASTYERFAEGFRAGIENGDRPHAAYCLMGACHYRFLGGEPLERVEAEVEKLARLMAEVRIDMAYSGGLVARQAVKALRGLTASPCSFDDESFREDEFVASMIVGKASLTTNFYLLTKLQLGVLFEDYTLAAAFAEELEKVSFVSSNTFMAAEHALFRALLLAAGGEALEEIERLHARLADWARGCPENFEAKRELVAAELARLRGQHPEAGWHFERAAEAARSNGSLRDAALAAELAGRYFVSRGREAVGRGYLGQACEEYARWGAHAKARQLDARWGLSEAAAAPAAEGTALGARDLDALAVIKASMAISSEIQLPALLKTLMRQLIEHAGAQTGALVLLRDGRLWIEAGVGRDGGAVERRLLDVDDAAVRESLPCAVLSYVRRTREKVLLAEAAGDSLFASDPYIARRRPRSLLCLPMLRQGELVGLLYLENELASDAFGPERVAVSELLASQAVISIENSLLYAELEERVRQRTAELEISLATIRDTQAQLLQASKMAAVGQLAAGVSHEINNPLGVILGFSQAMQREIAKDDPQFEPVSAIVREALRCKDIVRELLTFSRAGTGKREPLDLNELARSTLVFLEHRAKLERVELSLDLHERPMSVLGSRTQLQQVIVNLGTNAMDAMKGGGKITLRTRRAEDGRARIEVEDNGSGIPEKALPRIFEPFFTTKEVGRGTGLGLSVSYELVQQHGGAIEARSTVGKGTTMIVTLPLNASSGAPASAAAAPRAS